MTTKRSRTRHFGTIRKLKSGRFQARYFDADGTRQNAPGTFGTKTDARLWLDEVSVDLSRGTWRDPKLGRVTLEEWARTFMETKAHRKPKTIEGYESLLASRILPRFASRSIVSIRTSDVLRWLSDMASDGVGVARQRQALGLLSQILDLAVRDGRLVVSPCAAVERPPVAAARQDYLGPDEVDRLAEAMPHEYAALAYVLCYGGLRFGEAVALRVGRCDLLHSRLAIVEGATEVHGKLEFGPTKTHQTRTVDVPAFVRDLLSTHIEGLERKAPDAFVFADSRGGPLRYSNFYRAVWKPALACAGLAQRGTHVGRRTSATLLLAHGADVKDVQTHLGHRDAKMTLNVYCAPFEGKRRELAGRLDEAWKRARDDSLGHAEGTREIEAGPAPATKAG